MKIKVELSNNRITPIQPTTFAEQLNLLGDKGTFSVTKHPDGYTARVSFSRNPYSTTKDLVGTGSTIACAVAGVQVAWAQQAGEKFHYIATLPLGDIEFTE